MYKYRGVFLSFYLSHSEEPRRWRGDEESKKRFFATPSAPLRMTIFLLLILYQLFFTSLAYSSLQAENGKFCGEVNSDNINLRVDATVSSESICRLNRGDILEVVKISYDWCKVRLPRSASSFVKKDLFLKISDNSAKALGENVNVRLHPSQDAPVIGEVSKDEIVEIIEDKGDWLRISAVNNSFGWVNKKFIDKVIASGALKRQDIVPLPAPPKKPVEVVFDGAAAAIEGIIEPYGKIFKRKGTHKLVTADNKVFILKGNSTNLNSLTYHKVKVSGNISPAQKGQFPVIEILKVEMLE